MLLSILTIISFLRAFKGIKNKLNTIDSNIIKYATRKKPGETAKQRYNKIIHYAKLGIELDDKSN